MAIPKSVRATTVRSRQNKSKVYVIIGVIAVILGIAVWYFSDYWPWPSRERINERLEEVIDTCMGNERSLACKKIKERYSMSFKYCKNFKDGYDFWNKKPIYGVAWEGQSDDPPQSKITINGRTMDNPYSNYYGCTDHP